MRLPAIETGATPHPTQPSALVPGTVLFTNAPDGVLIKPLPVSFEAGGIVGPARGWPSIAAAIDGAAVLSAGDQPTVAVVRSGARFVAQSVRPDGPFTISGPLRNYGGLRWVHPDVVAFVKGAWVERTD